MRSAQTIEAQLSEQSEKQSAPKKRRGNPDKTIPFRWKPGQSGNPGGRPKRDYASEICQQIFEQAPELIGKGLLAQLVKGNGYVFKEAADRAYGKLKEPIEISAAPELVERLRAGRKRVAENKKC